MLEALGIIILLYFIVDGAMSSTMIMGWLGAGKEDDAWSEDRESPVGKDVTVLTAFGGPELPLEGSVELNGARWNACASTHSSGFSKGQKVRVKEIDGLTLIVTSKIDT